MGRQWARGMVHPARIDTPVFAAIIEMIERKTPEIFAAQIRALLSRPDAGPQLLAIDCPTLVLCGRQDSWSPLSQHLQMAAIVRGAEERGGAGDVRGEEDVGQRPQLVVGGQGFDQAQPARRRR